jgi:hypothetical protein
MSTLRMSVHESLQAVKCAGRERISYLKESIIDVELVDCLKYRFFAAGNLAGLQRAAL